ncbi:MAG: hypothetical protein GX280_04100 [Lentisphaerae bacterium]|jgi:DNA polymerase-1|nr:hypothetical protein [Lentisphaerota bacterium]
MESPVILVDAYSQIYRGYYAVRELTDDQGRPSNAIFAISRFLMKLKSEMSSEFGAFVADKDKCAFRLEIAPDYKANRAPMPDELKSQTETIFELISAFGWNVISLSGYEADDLIAAIAADAGTREMRVITPDKDISQIVTDRVKLLIPDRSGGTFECRGPQEIARKFGVAPTQIVDYLALIGDTSDNVPGINGVGPKTAAALIAQFGSISAALERADEIKNEKLRVKIKDSGELLSKNIQLIKLHTDIPGKPWQPFEERLRRRPPDLEQIKRIAQERNLRSLLRDIEEQNEPPPPQPVIPQKEQLELF